jgi:hypothetical protein
MGTLFMVNPPAKRKSRKRRTAKQKAATKKMLAANKAKRNAGSKPKRRRRTVSKTTTRRKKASSGMARKRGRKRTTTRRRRTSAKRRSPVTSLRRHSVFLTNPRKRRRRAAATVARRSRKRYRRNPSIVSSLKQGVMDAGATLAGGAAARIATGMLPLPKDGLAGAAAGLAVALGVGMAARKVVGSDTARFITAGAMQVPLKSLITSFVPQAGAFLGDYDNMSAYALPPAPQMGDYLNPGMYGQPEDASVEIGAYE